jgi:hypothetical protein
LDYEMSNFTTSRDEGDAASHFDRFFTGAYSSDLRHELHGIIPEFEPSVTNPAPPPIFSPSPFCPVEVPARLPPPSPPRSNWGSLNHGSVILNETEAKHIDHWVISYGQTSWPYVILRAGRQAFIMVMEIDGPKTQTDAELHSVLQTVISEVARNANAVLPCNCIYFMVLCLWR